jgi:beta-1,4-N-acetylglucosaminyltransferase
VLILGQLRALYVLRYIRRSDVAPLTKKSTSPFHMVIVLGSGGHTAEMMSLVRDINPTRCKHRTYIVSSGDSFSSSKALEIEKRIQSKHSVPGTPVTTQGYYDSNTGIWDIKTVPRARKIHQSLFTAPFSSISCLIGCLRALYVTAKTSKVSPGQFPGVVATNGPATAVIFIVAALLLKLSGIAPVSKMKIIYVESWARVVTLSLSGKILLRLGICEKFIVQWEALAKSINDRGRGGRKRVEWQGFLVE